MAHLMDDLAAFLRAQWDDEEQKARRIMATRHGALIVAPGDGESPSVFEIEGGRLLAEIAMKRKILNTIVPEVESMDGAIDGEWGHHGYVSDDLLEVLAEPYADLPDHPNNRPDPDEE